MSERSWWWYNKATGESKPGVCPQTLPDPKKNAHCRQYALCDRTDKYNSKIQTLCSCVSVSFMYSHTLLSSSRFCFFLFSLLVECTVQGILGKSVPLLVYVHRVSGPGRVHRAPWWWQLFWEDFCKPLEKWDLNFYQDIQDMRTTLFISSGKKPEGGLFKSFLSHLQGLI